MCMILYGECVCVRACELLWNQFYVDNLWLFRSVSQNLCLFCPTHKTNSHLFSFSLVPFVFPQNTVHCRVYWSIKLKFTWNSSAWIIIPDISFNHAIWYRYIKFHVIDELWWLQIDADAKYNTHSSKRTYLSKWTIYSVNRSVRSHSHTTSFFLFFSNFVLFLLLHAKNVTKRD